jgi:hypothetical protein
MSDSNDQMNSGIRASLAARRTGRNEKLLRVMGGRMPETPLQAAEREAKEARAAADAETERRG